jgi:hypothetical protein
VLLSRLFPGWRPQPCIWIKLTIYPSKKMRHRGLRWLLRHGHLDSAAVLVLDAPDHAGGWSVDVSVTLPDWDQTVSESDDGWN